MSRQAVSQSAYLNSDQSSFIEQRASRRARTLKTGYAAINSGFSSFRVVIRDLSETGAKLVSEGAHNLPNRFSLHVELDGFQVDCECVWRDGHTYGVRFCGPKQATKVRRDQVIAPTLSPEDDQSQCSQRDDYINRTTDPRSSNDENVVAMHTKVPIKNLRTNSVFGRRR